MHILAPHISCVVTQQEFEEAARTYSDIYVTTPSGKILRHVKLSNGRHVRIEVKEIPGFKEVSPEVKEEINFLPNGKVPFHLLEEIIEFFKQVMEIKKAPNEAMAHILFNSEKSAEEDRGYFIGIPDQEVSAASANYVFNHIKKGDIIVVDIHSHNNMNAFFSGTDNSDDKRSIGYSGVVGKLNETTPALVWRFNVNEIKRECQLDEIFDISRKEINIPSEWLDKVKTRTFQGYQGYQGYQGKGFPVTHWAGPSGKMNENTGNGHRNNTGRSGNDSFVPNEGDLALWASGGYQNYPDLYADLYTDPDTGEQTILDFESLSPKEIDVIMKGGEKQPKVERDTLPLFSGNREQMVLEYGEEAVDAQEQIELYLSDLEGMDDLLLDLMFQMYQLLTVEGQGKLAMKGF